MASPEERQKSERLANVERLRLMAMFEIVAFHVSERRLPFVAGLGLPTFLLLNSAFNCTLAERMGPRPFVRLKVTRLLQPWLVWSVIYLGVMLLERLRHHERLDEDLSLWMIVGGTYAHLWFVPFALFGGVLSAGLRQLTRAWSLAWVVPLFVAAGAALTVFDAELIRSGAVQWPALQWAFAMPSALLGFALGTSLLAPTRRLLKAMCALGAVAALGCLTLVPHVVPPDMRTRYALSSLLVCAAFIWPGPSDRLSRILTPLLLGIYLSHPLVVRVYQATHLPEPPLALYALLVFVLSAALVAVLRRTPLKFLV